MRDTNSRLEKISSALRKHLAKLPLSPEEESILRNEMSKETIPRYKSQNENPNEISGLLEKISFLEEKFESV